MLMLVAFMGPTWVGIFWRNEHLCRLLVLRGETACHGFVNGMESNVWYIETNELHAHSVSYTS